MKNPIGRVYIRSLGKMFYPGDDKTDFKINLWGSAFLNGKRVHPDDVVFDRWLFEFKDNPDLLNPEKFHVYENDVVQGGRCAALAVIPHNGYEFYYKNNDEENYRLCMSGDFPKIKKILGNKHENPELLKLTSENPLPYPEEKKSKIY